MAEIRINATGGVKLYDADDSHYAQILAGTISSNVDVLTLGSSSADFNIPVKVLGTTPTLTIGDAGAEDTKIVFDGNAQDFYIALDDSADDLLIGLGSTVGTTPAISIDENLAVKTYGDITMTGTTPVLTIGDAGAEDTAIVFDGNAQDFYIGLDDSADDLVIGLGSSVGTTPAISINSDRDVTISDGAIDFDVASHDTSNGLKLGGTLVTSTAAELNILDGVGSTAAELNMLDGSAKSTSSITIADADAFIVIDGNTTKQIPASDISSYAGGGITEADQWRLTTNLSVSTTSSVISSNLERVDTVFDKIGSGMSESSGIFTFPSTGIWMVKNIGKWSFAGNDHSCQLEIHVTTDNSSYTGRSVSCDSITQISSVTTRAMTSTEIMLDVTNTSNDKVAFKVHCSSNSTALEGDTSSNRTSFTFIRLGDT